MLSQAAVPQASAPSATQTWEFSVPSRGEGEENVACNTAFWRGAAAFVRYFDPLHHRMNGPLPWEHSSSAPLRCDQPALVDLGNVKSEPEKNIIGGIVNVNVEGASETVCGWAVKRRWGVLVSALQQFEPGFVVLDVVGKSADIVPGQRLITIGTGSTGLRTIVDRDTSGYFAALQEEIAERFGVVVSLAEQASEAIKELTQLVPGWDGYDGMPVQSQVAEHAYRFLEVIGEHTQFMPDIVPLSNGGVQLEWYIGANEVEVMIEPDCTTHVFFECTREGRLREFLISDTIDVSEVAQLFRQLRR